MKFYIIFITLFISSLTFSQETNAVRLANAKTELKTAVEKEDYEMAAELKKEIETREQIEDAVAKGDYEEAARLKKILEEGDTNIETAEDDVDESIKNAKFPAPSKGKAIVEFVKVTAQGWNAEIMLFDGEQYKGSSWGVSHMRLEVEPGEHLFWIEAADQLGFVEANLDADEVYIVIIDMNGTGSFMKIGLSPMSMNNLRLVDRARSVIYKHPVKVTPSEEVAKKQAKLVKKGFITKKLDKYEKKYKSSSRTKELNGEMNIPLEYMQR